MTSLMIYLKAEHRNSVQLGSLSTSDPTTPDQIITQCPLALLEQFVTLEFIKPANLLLSFSQSIHLDDFMYNSLLLSFG